MGVRIPPLSPLKDFLMRYKAITFKPLHMAYKCTFSAPWFTAPFDENFKSYVDDLEPKKETTFKQRIIEEHYDRYVVIKETHPLFNAALPAQAYRTCNNFDPTRFIKYIEGVAVPKMLQTKRLKIEKEP